MDRNSFVWRVTFEDSTVKYVKAESMNHVISCKEIDIKLVVNINRCDTVNYFTDMDFPDIIEA